MFEISVRLSSFQFAFKVEFFSVHFYSEKFLFCIVLQHLLESIISLTLEKIRTINGNCSDVFSRDGDCSLLFGKFHDMLFGCITCVVEYKLHSLTPFSCDVQMSQGS